MDLLLQRLDEIRKDRRISVYKLTEMADLSANTIYNWYRKDVKPTIEALEKVCRVLEVDISALLTKEEKCDEEYTTREVRLIENFRRLNDSEQDALENFVDTFCLRIKKEV
jgi:transcriptional regulator with XRE-family HTH domain